MSCFPILGPHCQLALLGAGYSYTCPEVEWSLYLCLCPMVESGKTSELVEMLFGGQTTVGHRNHMLDGDTKCWHQSVALPRTGNYVLPAAATTPYQELELSLVTEPIQSLDQLCGTPFPESIRTADNVQTFKHLLKTHFFNILNWCYLLVTLLLF